MNNLELNKVISNLFIEKMQKKSIAVNTLSEILDMDKKSIYRRLNNEVSFSFSEVCKVSYALGISIDGLIKKNLFGIILNGFVICPDSKSNIEELIDIISKVKQWIINISEEPGSEMGHISNLIPTVFFDLNKEVLQFHYYCINYIKGNKSFTQMKENINFIRITDALYELTREYLKMKQYYLIISPNPVALFLQKINYYRSIRLLTEEEFIKLKGYVADYIDLLESITGTDSFGPYKAKCAIYISELDYNSSFLYFYTGKGSFSSIQMYMLGWHISFDAECNQLVKMWFDEMKESSVLITQSNFNRRMLFFEEQRKLLKE